MCRRPEGERRSRGDEVYGGLGRTPARPLPYMCHVVAEEYEVHAKILRVEGLSSYMC
jgi:hypothetical protein